eukprot:TRINITY_DN43532_c0_g1_i1.p1 TRINITY_DN43532_c0_g1~~TRINITY_DN43532_c0_g1_i1.p1  ORF type:complete len:316 (-),score=46.33 TRINITY_DN43532_c0_g1_i1:10-894(-)
MSFRSMSWKFQGALSCSLASLTSLKGHGTCKLDDRSSHSQESKWFSLDVPLPGEKQPLQWLQRRSIVADGAGVHIGPTARKTVEHLWSVKLMGDDGNTRVGWKSKTVLDMNCGSGYVAVALARWGASVVGSDLSLDALSLAEANVKRLVPRRGQVKLCRLDYSDSELCSQMHQRFGPFDVIVAVDCVLAAPTLGGIWQETASISLNPNEILGATQQLAGESTDVILVVVDRAGDVKATAQALIEKRRWIELLDSPMEIGLQDDASLPNATVFHFRWKKKLGSGGDITQKLWAYM